MGGDLQRLQRNRSSTRSNIRSSAPPAANRRMFLSASRGSGIIKHTGRTRFRPSVDISDPRPVLKSRNPSVGKYRTSRTSGEYRAMASVATEWSSTMRPREMEIQECQSVATKAKTAVHHNPQPGPSIADGDEGDGAVLTSTSSIDPVLENGKIKHHDTGMIWPYLHTD